jgi:anti-sigma factor RsiW
METLVAYWAGDVDRADEIEAHVFACDACAEASAAVAAITERLRALVPPVLSRERLASLRARGIAIKDNVVLPGVRSYARFDEAEILVHHLSGLDLAGATSVGLVVRVEETGVILHENAHAPFDATEGAVLIACQRHFAAFPPNIVFEVTTGARTERFVVEHEAF